MPTPKQTLLAHIGEMHSARHQPPKSYTYKQLQSWHGLSHHRFTNNHFHVGVNLGPNARPPGWKTGEGAVPIVRRSF